MRRTSSTLVAIVLALVSIGIVMLASTSSVRGEASFGDPQYFIKRQLVWLSVAAFGGAVLARFDYHWLRRLIVPLAGVSLLLLILVFVPGVGLKVGGSHRWLRVGPMSVQPSELAKLVVIIGMSAWMSSVGRRVQTLKYGLILPLVGLAVFLGLIILEPDFGTTLLTGAVGMILLFAGGARVAHLAVTSVVMICLFILAVLRDPVRMGRVLAFLMPEKYPATAYHLAQSKVAFIRGGWTGVGLGNSIQKQFYLPEAHTDFILAIIGEELGFVATGIVVALFLGLLICGLIISFNAPDTFGRLLGFGITIMVALQATINVGVVTGCLPTKGLALPFISYGGSSLLASVAGIGILLNIAQHASRGAHDIHTRHIKDRAHRF
jgi:cell division protein FtsW